MTMNLECPRCHKPKFAKSIFGSFCTHCLYDSNRDAIQPPTLQDDDWDKPDYVKVHDKMMQDHYGGNLNAPTPSNNIDTELLDTLQQKMNNLEELDVLTRRGLVQKHFGEAREAYAADRNKLIKHLSFYYGLPVAEMRKVAEGAK